MTVKKSIFAGTAAALFIMASVSFSLFGTQSPKAYAEQSLQTFSALSPNAQHDLDSRIGGNAMTELQSAESAKNLKVLTYDQVKAMLPHPVDVSVNGSDSNAPGPQTADFQDLRFLSYVGADGTHIIGVDKDGMPAIVMHFQDEGGMHSGSVMVTGQTAGQAGGQGLMTSTDGPGGTTPTGQPSSTSCSQSSTSGIVCSTNGNRSQSPNCQTAANGEVTCSADAGSTASSPPSTNQ